MDSFQFKEKLKREPKYIGRGNRKIELSFLSQININIFFYLKYNLVTKNIRSLRQNKLNEIKIHIYMACALHYRL